jgi:hypothetical protein
MVHYSAWLARRCNDPVFWRFSSLGLLESHALLGRTPRALQDQLRAMIHNFN